MIAARIVGLLFVLLAAGCAGLRRAQPVEPPQSGATQAATVTVGPLVPAAEPSASPAAVPLAATAGPPAQAVEPQRAQPAKPPQIGATPAGTVTVEPMVPQPAPPVARSTGRPAVNAESPVVKTPAKVVASPAPAEPVRKKESGAQGPARQETSPTLDLKSLETRLKETKAIGVFTKLALKNQVDDLLNQFRAFYQGRRKTTLAELRRPYDLLILKVLALLQDSDPPLARAIVTSREEIWGILADPAKFASI